MRANHLVIVQNALERARCASQKRYVEEPLILWRDIETLVTFHTFPAAKAQREVLLAPPRRLTPKLRLANIASCVSELALIPTTTQGGSMQIEVTELSVRPRRPTAVPVVTMATPLGRFCMACLNSVA